MSQNELERVRADLEVMKKAAGIVGKQNGIWGDVLMAAFGVYIIATEIFKIPFWFSLCVFAVLGFVVITLPAWIGKDTSIQEGRRKKVFDFWRVGIVMVVMSAPALWIDKFDLPTELVEGIILLLLGLTGAIYSFSPYGSMIGLTYDIPMMVGGVLRPFVPIEIIMWMSIAMIVSGSTSVVTKVYLGRQSKVSNDAD